MPVCGFTDCGQTEVAIMGYAGGETGDGGSGVLLPRAASSRWLARFGNSPRAYSCTCKFEPGSVKALRGPHDLLRRSSPSRIFYRPRLASPPHLLG